MSGPMDLTIPLWLSASVMLKPVAQAPIEKALMVTIGSDPAVAGEETDVAMRDMALGLGADPVVGCPSRPAGFVNRRAHKWDPAIETALGQRVGVDVAALVGFGELFQDSGGHHSIDCHALRRQERAIGRNPLDRTPGRALGPQAAGHR